MPNTLGSIRMQQSVSASSIDTTGSMNTTCTTPNMSPAMNNMSKTDSGAVYSINRDASQSPEGRLKIQYLLTPGQSSTASFPNSAASTPEKEASLLSPRQSMAHNVTDPAVIPASNDAGNAELSPLFGSQPPLTHSHSSVDPDVLEAARILMSLKRDVRSSEFFGHLQKPKQKQVSRQLGSLHTLKPAHDSTTRITKKTSVSMASNAIKGKKIAPNVNGSNAASGSGNRNISASPKKAYRAKNGDKNGEKTAQEGRNRTAAPSREDKDFESIPDFVPVGMRAPGLKLVYEEKANALDLSADKHRHLLTEQELGLASSLRLDCATYLTSKRRIFKRCVECIHIGKVFRKTDAQKACNIDVNKASKLWTSFYMAELFNEHHFAQHIKA
jgi:hypothetical protein